MENTEIKEKIETNEFPMALIVGLGGIGSDIVSRLYQRFISGSPTEIEKAKIDFLCFDTDMNDIALRREVMPVENVVQTSAVLNLTVEQYLEEIKDTTSVQNWFDDSLVELKRMTLNDGAGQIRMASRLALNLAIAQNKLDIIKDSINRILASQAGKSAGNDIRVHIICSIAGGTGAGSFLQLAYFIKEILKNEKGFSKPRITGYFLLADVLCQDPQIQFDEAKKQNTMANTYASLKELNGIFSNDIKNKGFDIDFEYRFGLPKEHPLPDFEPFETCYLYDFDDSTGQNRGKSENYFRQMEDYVYLNVLSPIGAKTRSASINDILSTIKDEGLNRYATTGVAKIVYPVDDLFRYFSARRVADNLMLSWTKIDLKFNELLLEYKRMRNLGIHTEKPQLSKFFRDNIESLANIGSGVDKMIFKKIYDSTQVFDKNGHQVQSKANAFFKELEEFLVRAKNNRKSLQTIDEQFEIGDTFFEDKSDQDIDTIQINEEVLKNLRKEVLAFISNTKALGVEEAFLGDYQEQDFLSDAKSRINTYLIHKESTLHPLGVRYFMYELSGILNSRTAALKDECSDQWDRIEKYAEAFDIKDEKEKDDRIETAIEAYRIYEQQDKRLIKKLAHFFGGSGSLSEFKESYAEKARRQKTMLNQYAISKLRLDVYTDVKIQIDKFIEQIEEFFSHLGDISKNLNRKAKGLENMHYKNSDKSTQFVMNSPDIKKKIYDEIIAIDDDLDFPTELSKLIYSGLYKKTYLIVNKRPKHEVKAMSLDSIMESDVVEKQFYTLKDKHSQGYSGYNVIQAMQMEAQLLENAPHEHLKKYFSEAIKLANPLGAIRISKKSRINSWALHPDCVSDSSVTEADLDDLLGGKNDFSETGGYRLVNHFFNRTEIIRENSAFLLMVPDNFPNFAPVQLKNSYISSSQGKYYKAYVDRIADVEKGISVSPHLDKRWHYPGYFPNLGEPRNVLSERIYKAFFWGMVSGDFQLIDVGGEKRWGIYQNNGTFKPITNQHQGMIDARSISDFISNGLFSSPVVVDIVLNRLNSLIEENRAAFIMNTAMNRTTALYSLPIFQTIIDFRFPIIFKKRINELHILSAINAMNLKDKEAVINTVCKSMEEVFTMIGERNTHSRKALERLIKVLTDKDENLQKKVMHIINSNKEEEERN